ncbi:MAG: diguanylate cyclase [Anaerolineales bacterium]
MDRLKLRDRLGFLGSTRWRVSVALLFMAILPVALIVAFSYRTARETVFQRLDANLNAVADLKHTEVMQWRSLVISDTLLLANNFLNQEHITTILNPNADEALRDAFANFLTENLISLQNARAGYVEILFVDREGNIFISTDPERVGENVADWEAVSQTFASQTERYIENIHTRNGYPEMSFGHAIHQVNPAAMIPMELINSAVIIRVNLEQSLYPLISAWPASGETGEILLVTERDGEWVFASPLRFDESQPLRLTLPESQLEEVRSASISSARNQILETTDYKGATVLSGYRRIPQLDWGLLIQQDRAEALAPVEQLRSSWIAAALFVLLVALLVATVLARSLTDPLHELTRAARRVGSGDLSIKVGLNRKDEFGELSNAFNNMIDSVRDHARRIEQHTQELQALVNLSDTFMSTMDTRSVLERALHEVIRATQVDGGTAVMMLEGGNEFQTMAVIGLSQDLLNLRYPLDSHTASGYAMRQRKVITSTDIRRETRFSIPPAASKLGILGLLSAPMVIEGRPVGALSVASLTPRTFSQDELELTQAIANHTAVALERIKLIDDLEDSYDRTLGSLAVALDTRDRETEGHSQRVVAYTQALAERLGVPAEKMQEISRGALLHDIGKIGIPDSILHKTGKLTSEEWQIVRKHPEWGKQILAGIRFLEAPAEMVFSHHEHWDGGGYPRGLKGEEIPFGARIFAVVDAFDAITSYRPYRSAASYENARIEIRAGRGTQFDPKVVDAFLEFTKEDWARLRGETGASSDGKATRDMGSLRRVGSGQLQAMNVIISALTSSLEQSEMLERTAQKLVDVTRAESAGIYLMANGSNALDFVAGSGIPDELVKPGDYLDGIFRSEILMRGQPGFTEDLATASDPSLNAIAQLNPAWKSCLSLPIREGQRVAGTLVVFSRSPYVFDQDDTDLFEQVAKQLGPAILNARAHEKIRRQAITDRLTGAYNRHYLDDFLSIEVKRCQRYQRPLSLVLLDIDHFKTCNDRAGHQTGDQALRDVVQLLNLGIRSVDLVARYGGEEFLVVLPETEAVGAVEAAERVRILIEKHPFPCGKLTASLGVVSCPYKDGDAPDANELISRADQALYQAKKEGRNRVELWAKRA